MDWSDMFKAPVIVFGCGNTLFGDDGAGPAVVSQLAEEHSSLPGVAFVDAGTSIRSLLADLLLSGARPRRIVLVDVVSQPGRLPGSVEELSTDCAPDQGVRSEGKAGSAAALGLHMAPTPVLLNAIRQQLGCEVRILTVQAAYIPEAMDEGLSQELSEALPGLKVAVLKLCSGEAAPAAGLELMLKNSKAASSMSGERSEA